MMKPRINHLRKTVLTIGVCLISTTLGLTFGSNKPRTATKHQPISQNSDEKLIKLSDRYSEPLVIENLRLNGAPIARNRKFDIKPIAQNGAGQSEGWLERLEIDIKNTSDKKITYVIFELQFLDTQTDGLMMVYNDWSIGINPNVEEVFRNRKPLNLFPGDTTTLTLSGKDLGKIKSFLALRKFELSDMQNIGLNILYLLFEDGIKWETGRYFKPNPKARSGYELINQ